MIPYKMQINVTQFHCQLHTGEIIAQVHKGDRFGSVCNTTEKKMLRKIKMSVSN